MGLLDQLKKQRTALQDDAWGNEQQSGDDGIIGVSVPVKINTPLGDVRCYVHLSPEFQDPTQLLTAIRALHNAGYKIDAWKKAESDDWNGVDKKPYQSSFKKRY